MTAWPMRPLAEVATIVRGVTFDKSQVSNQPGNGAVPILRAGNIQRELLTDQDLVYVAEGLVRDEQLLKRGDIAICMSSGSPTIVGKTAYLGSDWRGSVGAFCAIVRFNPGLHPRFGSYWFRSPEFFRWRDCNAKGANIQNLRRGELETLAVPVPPPPVQERLLAFLDEADELQKLRRQADSRASDLLPALFVDMFGDPIENPMGWPVEPVSSFVSELQGGRNENPAGADEAAGRYRVLKISAVTWGDFRPGESKPLAAGYEPPATHVVRAGDLLFSRANTTELVGATSYVFETPPNLLLPDKLWRFVWHEPRTVESLYVWWLFQASSMRRELGQRATGTGGSMKNISKPKVMTLKVPVPPLALQKEFVQRALEIRELEQHQTSSRRRLDDLFQATLHRAFEGEL